MNRRKALSILPALTLILALVVQPVFAEIITLKWPGGTDWTFVDVNNDGKNDYRIEINPYNLQSASGSITMTFDTSTRTLKTVCDLKRVRPLDWVNGYPEIYVGRKPWVTEYANGLVDFPLSVSTLQSSSLMVTFTINLESLYSRMHFNIAADAWIVRPSVANSPGTPPGPGDMELMVWLFGQNLGPAGSKVGEVTIEGKTWEVWREDSVSWGGWQYIAFKPKDWSIKSGTVSYDAAAFVRAAMDYATIDISGHYLLGWEIGTEWGTKRSGGTAQFSWTLSGFSVSLK